MEQVPVCHPARGQLCNGLRDTCNRVWRWIITGMRNKTKNNNPKTKAGLWPTTRVIQSTCSYQHFFILFLGTRLVSLILGFAGEQWQGRNRLLCWGQLECDRPCRNCSVVLTATGIATPDSASLLINDKTGSVQIILAHPVCSICSISPQMVSNRELTPCKILLNFNIQLAFHFTDQ